VITLLPVVGLPEIQPGDDLAALIADRIDLVDGDVVVVAQKVVSKAEGALVRVPEGEDRAEVRRRLVEQEAVRVVVRTPWTAIVETRHGLVCANAGIDASNVADGALALLPVDPDASARRLRAGLAERTGRRLAVVVTDTFGRPWREGQTDVAIGLSGMAALRDERGGTDRFGTRLEVTAAALADELAAAADLARRGKADGHAVVVVRGFAWATDEHGAARDLCRPAASDLFPRGRGALADALAGPAGSTSGAGGAAAVGTDAVPRPDDVDRVVRAARAGGGDRVAVAADAGQLVLAVDGHRPADLVALGAAAGTARAALLDLGLDGVVDGEPPQLRVTIVPEPVHDPGR